MVICMLPYMGKKILPRGVDQECGIKFIRVGDTEPIVSEYNFCVYEIPMML